MAGEKADRKKIVDALNVNRSYELGAIMQYMGHHYEVEGMESPSVRAIFRATAMDEMKHAEMLAERIVYLGGIPVQKATPTKRGGAMKTMIKQDLDAENEAIERYQKDIRLCSKLGDSTSRRMLEEILADEERHADTWETVLGVKK